jgi:CubicO group peptidase (beta-lactamase class C family)
MTDSTTDDPVVDVLEVAIERWTADLGIPGVAVGIIENGRTRTTCAGVTSLRDPMPVTDETIFQIGSISKTFTGTAAMVLVDQGRLDLDAPVRSYVPDLRLSSDDLTEQLTARHLLTHVTGWVGDYFGDTGEGDDALGRFVAKLAKAPQLTPLGEVYSYNNSAFNLAAHLVATVNGTTFERAVRQLVLRPLEMNSTFYDAQDAVTRRVAVGHRDGVGQVWRRPRSHNGGGGVLSCVADLLKYAAFHLGDGSPLMSSQTLDEMHRASRPAGSLCDEVGLVWMIDTYAGHTIVHHGGTTNGYQADLRLVPELGLAWALLTNSDHHHQLDRLLKTRLLGPDDPATAAFVPDDLFAYVGSYEAVLAALRVTIVDGALCVDVATPASAVWNAGEAPPEPEPTRLAFRDEDRVEALDMPFTGHRGEFIRSGTGEVVWFRWDGRIARRVPA